MATQESDGKKKEIGVSKPSHVHPFPLFNSPEDTMA